ncbi:hypothetical protein LX87_04721 [Larkinella arboricola]|uniref:Secreted protein n=1 Tax=Larkinella arboricola TaxID=643671 RepID=A0A327WMN9_LARAB|nr:hypothetical protein [Larkinella arboricola]RAJ93209.1 hypothetical protein LX87_04721 [Larkinella arboricola]
MIVKPRLTLAISALLALFFSSVAWAQKPDSIGQGDPFQRIQPAPESVFKMFREAGMQPVNRELTPSQKEMVRNALAVLPPLHQRILRQHLQSISFMDNMPNTALTSVLDSVGGLKMFNITFRAGLLDETISEWATWKENTCFNPVDKADYQIRVQGGNMDALIYVLLHEATHVVDAVTQVTPYFAEKHSVVKPTPFTKNVWRLANVPEDQYIDSLLEKTRFRSGRPMMISQAPEVYQKLAKTPFPSLYGMAAWSEDLAELTTIYHLTTQLNQPFHIVVTKNNVELARFEPMKNVLVRRRLGQLAAFYAR